jgi:hypothetical protein
VSPTLDVMNKLSMPINQSVLLAYGSAGVVAQHSAREFWPVAKRPTDITGGFLLSF